MLLIPKVSILSEQRIHHTETFCAVSEEFYTGVRARTGVRRELAAKVDMNVLRWFGHVERIDNERLLK